MNKNGEIEKKQDYRVEKDSIGTKDVPQNVYYGVQSLRAAENFHITGPVSYTHLTLPTIYPKCRSRWSPYH